LSTTLPRSLSCATLGVALLALVGCSDAAKPSASPTPSTQTPSSTTTGNTLDPNSVLNPIPYNVREPISLPGDWEVEVMRVQRGFTNHALPAAPPGQEYVAVDVHMTNNGTANQHVVPAAVFTLLDQQGSTHAVVISPAVPDMLNGTLAAGASRTGRLLFLAPKHLQLRMLLDGQKMGSQQSIWQIDPPTAPKQD
jgi:hypothetical protein